MLIDLEVAAVAAATGVDANQEVQEEELGVAMPLADASRREV